MNATIEEEFFDMKAKVGKNLVQVCVKAMAVKYGVEEKYMASILSKALKQQEPVGVLPQDVGYILFG